jgi:hypothetical protein
LWCSCAAGLGMVPATVALMIVGPAKFDEKENTTMAEGRSLTTREAVEGVLASEHADVLRESVAVMVREIMELEVVRHEALSDRAGCETPTVGCRSSPEKLRAAWTRSRGRGREAALTTTGRAGTIGRCGPGKQGREA